MPLAVLLENVFADYETSPAQNSEPQNIEYRTAECRRVASLAQFRRLRRVSLSLFYKKDRIPSFVIRHSMFVIRYSLFGVSFIDQTGPASPSASAET